MFERPWYLGIQQQQKTLMLLLTGLNICIARTKLPRLNAVNTEKILLDKNDIDDVENFTYLRAKVNKTGGTKDDMKRD